MLGSRSDVIEEVTRVDNDCDKAADELCDDRDTGEVVVLFPDTHGTSAAQARARLAEIEAENQALREQVTELEDFNREAAFARERVFMRMRRELIRRQRTIEELEAARDEAATQFEEACQGVAEREALMQRGASELERAATRIDELERELATRDHDAEISSAYRSELETGLDQLRAERDELLERAREQEQALAAAAASRSDAIAELEERHGAELRRLHERAVRALSVQWLALTSS